jgi:hypothetical protein
MRGMVITALVSKKTISPGPSLAERISIDVLVVDLFRSRAALEAESSRSGSRSVYCRSKPVRLPFTDADRVVLSWICRLFPSARGALSVIGRRQSYAGIE